MPNLTRRAVVIGAVAAPLVARAQSPVIKIVVPFPPGGTVDPIARLAQPGLQQRLGASIVIENKSGASGSIGAAQLAKSPPDGNTWLFVFDTHAVNPALIPNLPFDTEKELDPVLLIGTAPYILAKHPSRPWRHLGDLIDAAKAKPDSISFATVGSGSVGHLAMAQLSKRAGVRLIHAPYRGGGPAMNDALAGHVDTIIGSAALATPQLKAEKLVGLVNTGAKRLPSLPDIATAAESGFPGFEAYAWWGVFAPAGTPKPVVERFAGALTEIFREERNARTLSEAQQIELRLGGPDELRTFFAEQMKLWGTIIREEGIKGDT